jgi:hypothetical protein
LLLCNPGHDRSNVPFHADHTHSTTLATLSLRLPDPHSLASLTTLSRFRLDSHSALASLLSFLRPTTPVFRSCPWQGHVALFYEIVYFKDPTTHSWAQRRLGSRGIVHSLRATSWALFPILHLIDLKRQLNYQSPPEIEVSSIIGLDLWLLWAGAPLVGWPAKSQPYNYVVPLITWSAHS